jgi:sulfhydrogenase subunit beta (sulfur reductase)
MMYILEKKQLEQVLEKWSADYEVFAPQKEKQFSAFIPVGSGELALDKPHNTRYPPKSLFLPQTEVLLRYNSRLNQLEDIEMTSKPRILFGIRPCDAHAATLLDTVFATDENSDPYWINRRKDTLLIGLGCQDPPQTCFCTTVGGGPFDHQGLDALMTKIDDVFFIEVFSEEAKGLFSGFPKASKAQQNRVEKLQENAALKMEPAFETKDLKQKLDDNFDSDFWGEISESCLGCGVCTFLCPTCFCFDIVDEVQRNERVRNWDTCMFRIYSQEASGHNPRPSRKERTRQRLSHKYSYWLDHIGEIGCTGCGRCVRYCPVGLDIRAMLRAANALEMEFADA